MLVALLSGWFLLRRFQEPLLLDSSQKFSLLIGAFCGAMLGAKLPFALADWEGLQSGAVWFSNGKTILCGMVGAYLGVEVAKWIADVRIKTGDSFAVPMAVAVGIGRFSCLVAGCCYGTPSSLPWAMRFSLADQGAVPRHPTQLYEALFHLTMAALLLWLYRRQMARGQLIKLYIIMYLFYRFFSEAIRPEPRIWLGLTSYQWFALAMLPIFLLLWWRDAHRQSQHTSIPLHVTSG